MLPYMERPLPRTHLSLHRYARIMGINPIHFAGASAGDVMPSGSSCNDIWRQYSWQANDRVSRFDLAETIFIVEEELSLFLGYPLAPTWVENEIHQYPSFHRQELRGNGRDIAGRLKGFPVDYGKFIAPGVRIADLIATPTVVGLDLEYVDNDADGFNELAVITVATTVTDPRLIKVFYPGHDGDLEWEIRPIRGIVIAAGVATIYIDSWLMIDPILYDTFPTVDQTTIGTIDISTDANFLTEVEVYHEYVSDENTTTSAELIWEPPATCSCGGVGCDACSLSTQDACIHVRDFNAGLVAISPVSYDDDNAAWVKAEYALCREPDAVRLSYYAGDVDRLFLANRSLDPLSAYWAQTIAWMATARLERPFCSCANLTALQEDLRQNLASTRLPTGAGQYVTRDVLSSPFGTLKGEVWAWKRCLRLKDRRGRVAVI
jgi:hypothetical protein